MSERNKPWRWDGPKRRKEWRDISTAPLNGTRIEILLDHAGWKSVGWWSDQDACFRFDGDDGPDDDQPLMWRPATPAQQQENADE